MKARLYYTGDFEYTIDYIVYSANNNRELKDFVGDYLITDIKKKTNTVITTYASPTNLNPLRTKTRNIKLKIGDYIIKDLDGYFSVLTKEDFDLIYTTT